MITEETRKILTMAPRSEAMILSMSSPCVDKSKGTRTARTLDRHCDGIMVSPLESTREIDCSLPLNACVTSS